MTGQQPDAQGDLNRFPIPRLFFFLLKKAFLGQVEIAAGPSLRGRIFFRDGLPVFAALPSSRDVLGRILLERGLISEEVYHRSLQELATRKQLHGQLLIEMGVLDERGLVEGLRLQLYRKLSRLFPLTQATVSIWSGDHHHGRDGEEAHLQADSLRVIYHGVRNAFDAARLQPELDKLRGHTIQIRPGFDRRQARYAMADEDLALVTLLTRSAMTLPQILRVSNLGQLETRMLIYTLWVTEALIATHTGLRDEPPPSGEAPYVDAPPPVAPPQPAARPAPRPAPPPPAAPSPPVASLPPAAAAPRTLPRAPGAPAARPETVPGVQALAEAFSGELPLDPVALPEEEDTSPAIGLDATGPSLPPIHLDATGPSLARYEETPEPIDLGEQPLITPAPLVTPPPPGVSDARFVPDEPPRFGAGPLVTPPPAEPLVTPPPPALVTPPPVGAGPLVTPPPVGAGPLVTPPPVGAGPLVTPPPVGAGPLVTPPLVPPPDLGVAPIALGPPEVGVAALILPPPEPGVAPLILPEPGVAPIAGSQELPPIAERSPLQAIVDGSADAPPLATPGRTPSASLPPVRPGARPTRQSTAMPPSVSPQQMMEHKQLVKSAFEGLKEKNHFQVLELARSATTDVIRDQYFKLAKVFHPDRCAVMGAPEMRAAAEEVFRRINEAHTVLTNPEARKAYEEELDGAGDKKEVQNALEAEFVFQKGVIFFRKKNYAEALHHFEEAFRLNPKEGEHQAWIAWTLFHDPKQKREQSLARAKDLLLKAIKAAPQNATCHYYLGEVYLALGDEKRAKTCFNRTVECQENHVEANRHLRLMAMRKEKEQKKTGLFGKIGGGKKK
jgi:curved DNA-binding protein CbpA